MGGSFLHAYIYLSISFLGDAERARDVIKEFDHLRFVVAG